MKKWIMLTIYIDQKNIQVAPGTTILEAAGQLGIEIPTLCFLKGYQPSTSCLVCMVKDHRSGRLVPACATRAVDGMELESETEEIHRVRRTALELLLSDHVGDCLAPCFFACPAHMDIPLMLRQIGEHQLREAIATVKRDIALPAILGRVCPKPCEKGCRRNAADDPVAVCELKRHVADADLASGRPYLPECRPASGKRVAIVGAGPTGSAAAYHLQQQGHQCVIIDRNPAPGGRLRDEFDRATLPHTVLEAELRQIVQLGVQLRMKTAIEDREAMDALCQQFDAVLVACGRVEQQVVRDWGLDPDRRGVAIDKETFQTSRPGVFAAGNAIRGKGLVVRSVADGKEVAAAIHQYLSGSTIRGAARPFSSRVGQLEPSEVYQLAGAAGQAPRQEPPAASDYSANQAASQSHRCLVCGCHAHGKCKLEYYAQLYGADPGRFAGMRRSYEIIGRESSVTFEPGKCIKCELCVQIAAQAKEPLGLTFVGRGFDVRLAVPFDGSLEEALTAVADECIAACPTAALSRAGDRVAPDLAQRSCCGGDLNCPTAE